MLGEVTLTSGATASYYVDAKRAILRQPGFGALAELVAAEAVRVGASAVGGMTMGADPIASAAISDPAGRDLLAFFVRKEKKQHGLHRWVEGPLLAPGTRVLIVEDVVTTGGSTVEAIERCREEGLEIAGTVACSTGSRVAARTSSRPPAALPTPRWRRSTTSTPSATTARRSTRSGAGQWRRLFTFQE